MQTPLNIEKRSIRTLDYTETRQSGQEESFAPIKHRRASTNHFRKYDIWVARKLGSLEAAILLAELSNRLDYHEARGELHTDKKHGGGWFYLTHELAYERTYLTRRKQDSALRVLIKLGLVEKRSFGCPPKRHFRLNDDAIEGLYREPCEIKHPHETVSADLYKNAKSASEEDCDLYKNAKSVCTKTPNCPRGENGALLLYKETLEERDITGHPLPPKPDKPSKQAQAKAQKTAYRENVSLTEDEYWKLKALHGEAKVAELIDILDAYKGATGKTYKSDYHTMLPAGWVVKRWAGDGARTNSRHRGDAQRPPVVIKRKPVAEQLKDLARMRGEKRADTSGGDGLPTEQRRTPLDEWLSGKE